jgi:hypothetical protein
MDDPFSDVIESFQAALVEFVILIATHDCSLIRRLSASARSFDRDQSGRLSGFAALADGSALLAASRCDTQYGRSYEESACRTGLSGAGMY